MKKYLFFSIIIDILAVIIFKKYIFISKLSIIPTVLFVFSLFMGILYMCCKDDVLSFHIFPYIDEKNGAINNEYVSKSYFITLPIYFLLTIFFNNFIKVCLSFVILFGAIIGCELVVLKLKHKDDNDDKKI